MHLPHVPKSGVITLHITANDKGVAGPLPRRPATKAPSTSTLKSRARAPKRLVMVDDARTWHGKVGIARRVAQDLRELGNRVLIVYPRGTSGVVDGVPAEYTKDGIMKIRPNRIVFVGAESIENYATNNGIKGHVIDSIRSMESDEWDKVKMVIS